MKSNRSAIGARLKVSVDGPSGTRDIHIREGDPLPVPVRLKRLELSK